MARGGVNFVGGQIVWPFNVPPDFKGNSTLWNMVPIGSPFTESTVHFQLWYHNPCDSTQIIDLGSYRLVGGKVDGNNWKAATE